jgi:alpha-glucosidase
MMKKEDLLWWQKEIIYQIYPRSFNDGNGDGIGDLKGITQKLDYLEWLGIRAIWISPVYPSPMVDFGYDISDYTDIHPLFGIMEDLKTLLQQAHQKNMKIIMDLVPNHTSDQHDWFKASRSSRDNPKRDWYIWKDPAKDGGPPNNWISEFGGSAWEYDEKTGQYYLHNFLKEQPDLNWRNPQVKEAIWEVMRFWLDLGVDGFRIDVLWYLMKDEQFRDNPPNNEWKKGMPDHDRLIPAFSNDQPEIHEVINEMRKVIDEYQERVLIGEIYLPIDRLVTYYGKEKDTGVHLPFNFHLLLISWEASKVYSLISQYEGALPQGGWPNWVLGNHDKARIKARTGEMQLHNAAMLLLTLRGTPTLYYGDEIGMDDAVIPKDKIQDPREIIEPGIGVGRDPQRTPMQWTAGKYAGFSDKEPWLPVSADKSEVNVETQRTNPDSLLSFYRKLIQFRQDEPALYAGSYIPAGIKNNTIAYRREYEDNRFLICLNFGDKPESFIPEETIEGTIEIAKNPKLEGQKVKHTIHLDGNDGMIIRTDG